MKIHPKSNHRSGRRTGGKQARIRRRDALQICESGELVFRGDGTVWLHAAGVPLYQIGLHLGGRLVHK